MYRAPRRVVVTNSSASAWRNVARGASPEGPIPRPPSDPKNLGYGASSGSPQCAFAVPAWASELEQVLLGGARPHSSLRYCAVAIPSPLTSLPSCGALPAGRGGCPPPCPHPVERWERSPVGLETIWPRVGRAPDVALVPISIGDQSSLYFSY